MESFFCEDPPDREMSKSLISQTVSTMLQEAQMYMAHDPEGDFTYLVLEMDLHDLAQAISLKPRYVLDALKRLAEIPMLLDPGIIWFRMIPVYAKEKRGKRKVNYRVTKTARVLMYLIPTKDFLSEVPRGLPTWEGPEAQESREHEEVIETELPDAE